MFLTRFPEATGRWQVSVDEGYFPRWDPRGDRLYFMEGFGEDATVMEVTVEGEEEPRLGPPEPLFEYPGDDFEGLDLTADGQRFVLVAAVEEEKSSELDRSGIKVVQNWAREFRP